MKIRNLITGGIIAGALFFLLGFLFYANLFDDYLKEHQGRAFNVRRTDMDLLYIGIGSFLQGLLLTYIFMKANTRSFGSGFVTGGIVGALVTGAMNCISYGTTNILSKKGMMADVLIATAIYAVSGAILGLIIGMKKKLEKAS
jgi:hypothetical protein